MSDEFATLTSNITCRRLKVTTHILARSGCAYIPGSPEQGVWAVPLHTLCARESTYRRLHIYIKTVVSSMVLNGVDIQTVEAFLMLVGFQSHECQADLGGPFPSNKDPGFLEL